MTRPAPAVGAHHAAQSLPLGVVAFLIAVLYFARDAWWPAQHAQRMPANRKANLRGTSGERVHTLTQMDEGLSRVQARVG